MTIYGPIRFSDGNPGIHMKRALIQISVCTYNRPVMLRACIESVLQTRIPEDTQVSLQIIDNAADPKIKQLTDELAQSAPIPVHYAEEPRRGISMARNRVIERALQTKQDYLIFLDDDETVDSRWLSAMWNCAKQQNDQTIVYGSVLTSLPSSTPEHIAAYFKPEAPAPNAQLKTCATNNVIIPMHIINTLALRFDETLALTGGEDTAFFEEAVKKGNQIIYCAEGIVTETIPASKASLNWIIKRNYRCGIQDAGLKNKNGRPLYRIFFMSAHKTIVRLIRTGLCFALRKKTKGVTYLKKTAKSVGSCAGCFHVRYLEYNTTHGE